MAVRFAVKHLGCLSKDGMNILYLYLYLSASAGFQLSTSDLRIFRKKVIWTSPPQKKVDLLRFQHLPRFLLMAIISQSGQPRLTFYYAHVGFYVTQGLVSASMPILVPWKHGVFTCRFTCLPNQPEWLMKVGWPISSEKRLLIAASVRWNPLVHRDSPVHPDDSLRFFLNVSDNVEIPWQRRTSEKPDQNWRFLPGQWWAQRNGSNVGRFSRWLKPWPFLIPKRWRTRTFF